MKLCILLETKIPEKAWRSIKWQLNKNLLPH